MKEKKELFLKIRNMPEDERFKKFPTAVSIYTHIGITARTYSKWMEGEDKTVDSSLSILDRANDSIDEALIVSCKKGNSSSLRTFFQLQNRLVERKEEKLKVEFSVGERFQIANEVIAGLREQYKLGGRACAVCGRPPVLLAELCEDRGQDTPEGTAVPSIPVSS